MQTDDSAQLRERKQKVEPTDARRVRIQIPPPQLSGRLWPQQADRIVQFQRSWERIRADLPPQLSRKHIGMISIGGVIGTGLFLGSADALRYGGPIGAFLGYLIVGTVVYCLCVSVGEMIAFLPNVGGVVGLADLYVDPALGFSLGWAAWYNWSVTLPAEITAAAVVIGFWGDRWEKQVLYLVVATTINCFPSRVYGEMEFYLSCMKVTTIVMIILFSLLIDLGASHQGPIGLKNWIAKPFPDDYLGIGGSKGHFLGFWAVIMQASFSFFGSEVPGIAAGEVIDATRNVPRALRKVWIRIILFYLGGILCSGLLVPCDEPLLSANDSTGRRSPFVIAFKNAGWAVLPHVVNAAILLSAWSAAASDIYISSRFLFFLARRGHAPSFLAHLFRYPRGRAVHSSQSDSDTDGDGHESDLSGPDSDSDDGTGLGEGELLGGELAGMPAEKHTYVMPLASVLVSASVGLLTFLSYGTGGAETAFSWLVSVASVASLQSWAGMLFTYIRWHQGTVHYERKYKGDDSPFAKEAMDQIAEIKKNRQWGQPYLAWYAFTLCMLVLFTNGWAVFVHNGWQIAEVDGESPQEYGPENKLTNPVSLFLAAYIPLPFFLLLTFGYKLIKQTEMMPLDKMTFHPGQRPAYDPNADKPHGRLERLLAWLMVI
ncbi:amino acid permease-domain-containing protein [Daedaleopsis nitida]|nr:amino acid permease-domain-containing protein [Daedaleopsis nitida]